MMERALRSLAGKNRRKTIEKSSLKEKSVSLVRETAADSRDVHGCNTCAKVRKMGGRLLCRTGTYISAPRHTLKEVSQKSTTERKSTGHRTGEVYLGIT